VTKRKNKTCVKAAATIVIVAVPPPVKKFVHGQNGYLIVPGACAPRLAGISEATFPNPLC
jgi:hypothetical protein